MDAVRSGILLIDKPRGMTSHDVVARVRRVARTKAVGHTGTLDPMADGLLILCIGPATRVSQFLVGLDKAYVGTITLGAISSTYDAEGDIVPQGRPLPAEADVIRAAMASQVGERIQLPPAYSAIKVAGKKLYEYARAGDPVPQKPRPVRIMRFDLLRYSPPEVHFQSKVGCGTYIRSMAQDLGLALECGAYLSQLRRTQVGSFAVDQALLLETLLNEPQLLDYHLLSVPEALAHLPKITIQPGAEKAIMHGREFTTRDILEFDGILMPGQPALVINMLGQALSVVRPEPELETEDEPEGEQAQLRSALGATPMVFRPVRVLSQPD